MPLSSHRLLDTKGSPTQVTRPGYIPFPQTTGGRRGVKASRMIAAIVGPPQVLRKTP